MQGVSHVGRLVGAVDQEQPDLGAVGRRVALLRHGELGLGHAVARARLAVRPSQLAAAPTEEAGGTGEALELHEGQRPVGPGIEADHRAQLGQGDLADSAPSGSWRVMRAAAEWVVTTSRPPATGSACWMTPEPSGTRVVHSSVGTARSSGMATTRPRGTSSVVTATSRDPSKRA